MKCIPLKSKSTSPWPKTTQRDGQRTPRAQILLSSCKTPTNRQFPRPKTQFGHKTNFLRLLRSKKPLFQRHEHAHPRCQRLLRPDRPGHARLALRLDDPPFFILTQPPPSTSPERQSRPSTPTHPSSRLSPPSTPRRTRLIRACSSLYDSTLPALTPTPRAVDDPGAYEPALPLHILTHIHHLQAGEIALATPAAALRLCLAYSHTCFPLPCVPSGPHSPPPASKISVSGSKIRFRDLFAASLDSSSFSGLSTAPSVGLDFAHRLLALWWSGFDAERRNALTQPHPEPKHPEERTCP